MEGIFEYWISILSITSNFSVKGSAGKVKKKKKKKKKKKTVGI